MENWWKNGVAFSCKQCAKCCSARDGMSYVYVNTSERRLLADNLRLSLAVFTKKYSLREPNGQWHLRFVNGSCIFLQNNKCTVHQVKPTQCRTWPFWNEVMESKAEYTRQVLDFCPGSNVKQPIVSASDIKQQIIDTDAAFFEV